MIRLFVGVDSCSVARLVTFTRRITLLGPMLLIAGFQLVFFGILIFSPSIRGHLLFSAADRFADFFKWLSAFNTSHAVNVGLPPFTDLATQRAILAYLRSNPYNWTPSAEYSLLGMPPGALLVGSLSHWLGTKVSYFWLYVLFVTIYAAYVGQAVYQLLRIWGDDQARKKIFPKLILIIVVFFTSYPVIFGLDRGNIGALAYSTLVGFSLLGFYLKRGFKPGWRLYFAILIGSSFRPQYILPFYMVIISGVTGCRDLIEASRRIAFWSSSLFITLWLQFFLASLCIRGYSLNTFLSTNAAIARGYIRANLCSFNLSISSLMSCDSGSHAEYRQSFILSLIAILICLSIACFAICAMSQSAKSLVFFAMPVLTIILFPVNAPYHLVSFAVFGIGALYAIDNPSYKNQGCTTPLRSMFCLLLLNFPLLAVVQDLAAPAFFAYFLLCVAIVMTESSSHDKKVLAALV